jgi:gas vesicle protein
MRRSNVADGVLPFVIGAAVGGVAALLLARKSGEELRNDIADGVTDGIEQVRSKGKDLKRRANRLAVAAKHQIQGAVEAGERAYAEAKDPADSSESIG